MWQTIRWGVIAGLVSLGFVAELATGASLLKTVVLAIVLNGLLFSYIYLVRRVAVRRKENGHDSAEL